MPLSQQLLAALVPAGGSSDRPAILELKDRAERPEIVLELGRGREEMADLLPDFLRPRETLAGRHGACERGDEKYHKQRPDHACLLQGV
ncbi:MAG: hypothetical protein DMG08_17465 [Acidobacteria bacterium]|nr:MAG: hypothetical protein DMG08_17465 [Acidobacteriota bacterium]